MVGWGTSGKIPEWNALAVQFDEGGGELQDGKCTAQEFLSLFFNSRKVSPVETL